MSKPCANTCWRRSILERAKLADPLLSDKPNGEVTYYDYPSARLTQNIFDPSGPLVADPYGGNQSRQQRLRLVEDWRVSGHDCGSNRHANGLAWAVLFNSTPPPSRGFNIASIEGALDSVALFNLPDQVANFASTLIGPALSAKNPVVNSATFQPGIVSGSWLSIFGSNLATVPDLAL